MDPTARSRGIVEERDATAAERAITEINPGFYCVRSSALRAAASASCAPTTPRASTTSPTSSASRRAAGERIVTVELQRPEEVAGINTRAELARMESDAAGGDRSSAGWPPA